MWYVSQPNFGHWDVCYATSTDALHWMPYGVVFSNGLQNALGTVRYDSFNGTFQMWYSWGGVSGQTGYADSNDGINWNDHGLVLGPGPDSYDAYVAQAPHVLYDQQEGLYKMWYTALQEIAFRSTIAYATSSDGTNWTKHGVVFSPKDGSWYSGRVAAPYVDKTLDGYLMYFYGGSVSSGPYNIGHVKSTDGINWDNNSVEIDLTPGSPGSWDSITVSDPWVIIKSDGKHILYYAGSDTSPLSENPDGIGIALQALTVVSPNGGENWAAGTKQIIEWESYNPNINYVLIEYSINSGQTWDDVDIWWNTGSYQWDTIPTVDSNQCLIRISDLFDPNVSDTSDDVFTTFQCVNPIQGDLNGDCYVDFRDFAIVAEQWLKCGNPFDPACQP